MSGDHDGWAHEQCHRVVAADEAAHEITDNRDRETVEADLAVRRRCSWQIKARDWDGPATYCGRCAPGGVLCDEHQAEDDGDEYMAAAIRKNGKAPHLVALCAVHITPDEPGHNFNSRLCRTPGPGPDHFNPCISGPGQPIQGWNALTVCDGCNAC